KGVPPQPPPGSGAVQSGPGPRAAPGKGPAAGAARGAATPARRNPGRIPPPRPAPSRPRRARGRACATANRTTAGPHRRWPRRPPPPPAAASDRARVCPLLPDALEADGDVDDVADEAGHLVLHAVFGALETQFRGVPGVLHPHEVGRSAPLEREGDRLGHPV